VGETVLIFPAGQPGADQGRIQALAEGRKVVGASSLASDPVRGDYDQWEWLPYISDPAFAAALATVVRTHDIGVIHAPHFVVWHYLEERLAEIAPGVQLRGGAETIFDHEKAYRALYDRYAALDRAPFYCPAVGPKPDLSDIVRAALFRQIDTISGMSSEEKLLALVDILRCAPDGDIVEIGTWWGKSAAMFVMLAHRYDVGPVLCVDPWASEALPQGDDILDAAGARADMDEAFRIFQINLAPLAHGRLNYIRASSAGAASRYGPGLEIDSETFGKVRYSGRIAVLHIDGNHTLENADEDMRMWTPHVAPGGWIIFDDYFWVFGDGPKRVGDAFIAREADRIQFSFVAGKALFVQLKA